MLTVLTLKIDNYPKGKTNFDNYPKGKTKFKIYKKIVCENRWYC